MFGFDILIDKKLKPWLVEVNVLPSLSSSSGFDKRIKTTVVCDILTLVGIRGYDKKKVHGAQDNEKSKPFRQSFPDISQVRQLAGNEQLSQDEMNLILDHEEEFSRKGNFSRIFPLAANVDYYERFFEMKRYNNQMLWAYIRSGALGQQMIAREYPRQFTSTV